EPEPGASDVGLESVLDRPVGEDGVDVGPGGVEDVDLPAGALGEVPPVLEDLVEDLGRLEAPAQLARDHRGDRLIDGGQPPAGDDAAGSLSNRRAWLSSRSMPVRPSSSRRWCPDSTTRGWMRTVEPFQSATMSSSATSKPRSLRRATRCSMRHISSVVNSSVPVSS